MTPAILILAAGSSSRMRGADKLLEMIDGTPLLTRIAKASLSTQAPVTVALPLDRPARQTALRGLPLTVAPAPHAAEGMAESLKAGLACIPAQNPVLILLADLPEITADDLTLFLTAWADTPTRILRGTSAQGTPGHPVGFPAGLRDELMQLSGDQGAKDIIAHHRDKLRLVPLPGQHATTDLDTPEDWAAWRALRARNL